MSQKRSVVTSMVAVLLIAAVAPGFAAAAGDLSVGVAQDGSDVTVTVEHNESAVENATVTVTALNNSSYAGEGSHATDANGTVSLSAPGENVTVEVTAEKDNVTGSTTAELVAVEDDEEEREFDSFGQRVSWFVHSLLGDDDRDGGIGDAVSEYVTSNNPSNDNKPEHAQNKTASNGNQDNDKPDKSNGKDKGKKKGNGNGNGHGNGNGKK